MIYINCGCGEKYIVTDDWKNIDFVDKSNEVIAHNILDVIYNLLQKKLVI